jgi:hypothetical protein
MESVNALNEYKSSSKETWQELAEEIRIWHSKATEKLATLSKYSPSLTIQNDVKRHILELNVTINNWNELCMYPKDVDLGISLIKEILSSETNEEIRQMILKRDKKLYLYLFTKIAYLYTYGNKKKDPIRSRFNRTAPIPILNWETVDRITKYRNTHRFQILEFGQPKGTLAEYMQHFDALNPSQSTYLDIIKDLQNLTKHELFADNTFVNTSWRLAVNS